MSIKKGWGGVGRGQATQAVKTAFHIYQTSPIYMPLKDVEEKTFQTASKQKNPNVSVFHFCK